MDKAVKAIKMIQAYIIYGIIMSIFPKYIPIQGIVKLPRLLIVFEMLKPVALLFKKYRIIPYICWIHIYRKWI